MRHTRLQLAVLVAACGLPAFDEAAHIRFGLPAVGHDAIGE